MIEGKMFEETSSEELLDFSNDNAVFNFIYAAILRFVYVIRAETKQEKRFYKFLSGTWRMYYFWMCISVCITNHENKGAPHN